MPQNKPLATTVRASWSSDSEVGGPLGWPLNPNPLDDMSYFADLSPHTYTPTDGVEVLNIGWLDREYPFAQGESSLEFREALRQLCENPIQLHRGFHECQFCPDAGHDARRYEMGNGQIRIKGPCGTWFAAPTMVHHYVTAHNYLPPPAFVQAVLQPVAIAADPS